MAWFVSQQGFLDDRSIPTNITPNIDTPPPLTLLQSVNRHTINLISVQYDSRSQIKRLLSDNLDLELLNITISVLIIAYPLGGGGERTCLAPRLYIK